jgi:phosphoribosylaminoimidazole-succinocarboxamide synthase
MKDEKLGGHKPIMNGKVRNMYDVPEREDLIAVFTTDRVSAFDKVVGEISGRGIILNRISNHWKNMVTNSCIVGNDIFLTNPRQCLELLGIKNFKKYEGRILIAKKAKVIPVEFIVRGYITGSLWEDYSGRGSLPGKYLDNDLPGALLQSQALPEPIFTPTTKASVGFHDEPLSYEEMVRVIAEWLKDEKIDIGKSNFASPRVLATVVRALSLEMYSMAKRVLLEKGIILADTKFEFGLVWSENSQTWDLRVVDEVLTPDSSRFWSADIYAVGRSQSSLDKQLLRNWVKDNPGKDIPDFLVSSVYSVYADMAELICK